MDFPPEIPLYERIYLVIRHVPAGQVATSGQIAGLVDGCTARMVGYALAALGPNTDVPWQRVINSQGKISPRSGGIGSALQRQILEAEGIAFDARGKVDLRKFGWPGFEVE